MTDGTDGVRCGLATSHTLVEARPRPRGGPLRHDAQHGRDYGPPCREERADESGGRERASERAESQPYVILTT